MPSRTWFAQSRWSRHSPQRPMQPPSCCGSSQDFYLVATVPTSTSRGPTPWPFLDGAELWATGDSSSRTKSPRSMACLSPAGHGRGSTAPGRWTSTRSRLSPTICCEYPGLNSRDAALLTAPWMSSKKCWTGTGGHRVFARPVSRWSKLAWVLIPPRNQAQAGAQVG